MPRLKRGRPVVKKPLQLFLSSHRSHSSTNAFFQSDIDCSACGQTECGRTHLDRKSTRLNSSHSQISYAVFCLKQNYLTMSHNTGVTVTPGSGWKASGATISISATPAADYHLTNWTWTGNGSISGTNNTASMTI